MADNVNGLASDGDEFGEVLRQKTQDAWSSRLTQYGNAVSSGNSSLADRIEEDVARDAHRLAGVEMKRRSRDVDDLAGRALRAARRSETSEREQVVNALMQKQGFVYPGVPQGLEGTPGPDQADQIIAEKARQRARSKKALLYVGEPKDDPTQSARVIIPGWSEMADMALTGMKGAGEVMAGTAGATGGPAGALVTGAIRVGERVVPRVMNRITAPVPGTSVPGADARQAIEEAESLRAAASRNPYPQAVKGHQGFMPKAEQRELVENYLERGGRLSQEGGGPWGRRDIQGDVRDVIQRSYGARQTERVTADQIFKMQDDLVKSGEISGRTPLGEIADRIARKTGVPAEIVLERLWSRP